MKIRISRASQPGRPCKSPPCEGAFQDGDLWFIEMSSLEEVLRLVDAVGGLIFDRFTQDDGDYSILIYDDYIE